MVETKSVSEKRNYKILNTEQAKNIVLEYFEKENLKIQDIKFGLPEIHDRYHIWKVPLLYQDEVVGDISVDAYEGIVNNGLSSNIDIIIERINSINLGKSKNSMKRKAGKKTADSKTKKFTYIVSNLQNTIIEGRSELALKELPEQCIDMIFTSPPYYNAKKEYSEYKTYDDYLDLMREVIRECKRVLIDGKFFIINSSHILIPRASRNESSTRIAVPFDLHQIFIEEGFEFIDDIIWQKPEGAGWASGRGRRFSADRNPMQYKAVPVTEYVMVYRKKSKILIDNFIRKHPKPELIDQSKIKDGYEKTNVWYISPARDKRHPAIFPKELAEKVIMYYSFKEDVILDPFGGIGTTAKAAAALGRRFCSIEMNSDYIKHMINDLNKEKHNYCNDFKYEYIDYSYLKSNKSNKVKLKEIIHELINSGITEDQIVEQLLNIKNKLGQ